MTTTIEHGILFSHASHSVSDDLVSHRFRSAAAAKAHGAKVVRHAPGIEYEPMVRQDPASPWLSPTGQTAQEVLALRWQA